jgi:phage terminase large subunit-like protein
MTLAKSLYDWRLCARPKQLPPPGDWFIWLLKWGRGTGKTRTGAEYVRSRIDAEEWQSVNIAGPTVGDTVDLMVRGTPEAPGLLGIWPPHQTPRHEITNRRLIAHNGAIIRYRGADEGERFRGPQADGGWCDEVDAWKPKGMTLQEAWHLFSLGIRLGPDPRIIVTSTPKRARLIVQLMARDDCFWSSASTYENRANLAPQFFRSIVEPLKGTRLGRQEINGEILEGVEDALLNLDLIDELRVKEIPELGRIVVSVDPAASSGDKADETGIVAAAVGAECDEEGINHGYLLEDRSCRKTPAGWAAEAVSLYEKWGADLIVGERNNGGEMVESVIRNESRNVPVKLVTTHSPRWLFCRGRRSALQLHH